MGVSKVSGSRFTCDGCGESVIVEKDQDEPHGIRLTVFETDVHGGATGDAWACCRSCVGSAVITALNNAK